MRRWYINLTLRFAGSVGHAGGVERRNQERSRWRRHSGEEEGQEQKATASGATGATPAYLCKAKDCALSKVVVSEIADYYALVGNLFVANMNELKKMYKAVVMDFIAGVEPLKGIMPKGYISDQAKMKYMLNPAPIMNYLIAMRKQVVSGLDIKSKGATQVLILAESMNMGGFWQNGQSQNNYAT